LSELLFVDPSILMSEAALLWLEEDDNARSQVVVSSAFRDWLIDYPAPLSSVFWTDEDLEFFDAGRDRARSICEQVRTFSSVDVELEDKSDQQIVEGLRANPDRDGAVLADELAFLLAHSWGLTKARAVLAAFGRAGVVVQTYGRRVRDEFIQDARRNNAIPEQIDGRLLARVGAKWLLTSTAGGVGAVLGGAAGSAILGPVGTVGGGAAGGAAGWDITRKVLRALDG